MVTDEGEDYDQNDDSLNISADNNSQLYETSKTLNYNWLKYLKLFYKSLQIKFRLSSGTIFYSEVENFIDFYSELLLRFLIIFGLPKLSCIKNSKFSQKIISYIQIF